MNQTTETESRVQRPPAWPGTRAGWSPVREVPRSTATRVIHLLLLLVVLHQLVGSKFMQRPLPGDRPATLYMLHEYVGLASLAVVGAFWLWALLRRGETRLGRLLPWFSTARLRAVARDTAGQLRRLVHGRAPDDADGALASAVHGLGLLAVSAMAVTGGVVFLSHGLPIARSALAVHKLVANLVWAYLFGHAGLAVLHHLLGSDILSRMFWVARRRSAGRTPEPQCRPLPCDAWHVLGAARWLHRGPHHGAPP